MDESNIVLILFGSFFLLLLIGAPVTVALGVSALASLLVLEENPIKLVQIAFNSVGSFPLMALPAFILAGALMEAAGISKRLVNIAESFAGPFTGGIAASAVLACLFFGAISGSGPATHCRCWYADDSGYGEARLQQRIRFCFNCIFRWLRYYYSTLNTYGYFWDFSNWSGSSL